MNHRQFHQDVKNEMGKQIAERMRLTRELIAFNALKYGDSIGSPALQAKLFERKFGVS